MSAEPIIEVGKEIQRTTRPNLSVVESGSTVWGVEALPDDAKYWVPVVNVLDGILKDNPEEADPFIDLVQIGVLTPKGFGTKSGSALIECLASHPNPAVKSLAAEHMDALVKSFDYDRIYRVSGMLAADPEVTNQAVDALLVDVESLPLEGVARVVAAYKDYAIRSSEEARRLMKELRPKEQ